jgi:hypothetical protein
MDALSLPTKNARQIARNMTANGRWSARIDGRSAAAKAIKRLVATYTAEIDKADNPLISRRIRELAELEILTAALRARALRGESIDPTAVPPLCEPNRAPAGRAGPRCRALRSVGRRMIQPLYKTLLATARKQGQSAQLEAASQRAALFQRFARDAARRLGCKPGDQVAVHYATLQLALELIQTRLIGGKEIDVSSLRWLSEQLDRYRPPPAPQEAIKIELAETLVGVCEKCGHVHQTDKPIHDPDPPPSPAPPRPPDSPPEKPSLPAVAAAPSNVVPLKRDPGSIHTAVLPDGSRPPLKHPPMHRGVCW